MIDLTPVFIVAGSGLVIDIIEKAMNHFGHGDKVVIMKVVGYAATAYYGLNWIRGILRHIGGMFGVLS